MKVRVEGSIHNLQDVIAIEVVGGGFLTKYWNIVMPLLASFN